MKYVTGLIITAILWTLLAWGQATPNGSSISFNSVGTAACAAPATGQTSLCGTATGVLISINGAAYAPITPTAPTVSGFVCTSVTVNASGMTGTGCTFK